MKRLYSILISVFLAAMVQVGFCGVFTVINDTPRRQTYKGNWYAGYIYPEAPLFPGEQFSRNDVLEFSVNLDGMVYDWPCPPRGYLTGTYYLSQMLACNCFGPAPGVKDKNDSPAALGPGHDTQEDPCGMPRWRVSEPYLSLWLSDEPLGYQPAVGQRVSFLLSFGQQELQAGYDPAVFSVGRKWNLSWLSYVSLDGQNNPVVSLPGGGSHTFLNGSDYLTNTRITGDTTTGFTVFYPDGSKDVYGFRGTNGSGAFLKAFLTERVSPAGQKTRFNYASYSPSAPAVRLETVIDGDGRTNRISYVSFNSYSPNLISQVSDPFGRVTTLLYDQAGHLTNITDVAGLSSSFLYDSHEWVTNMTTPYGPTAFKVTDTKPGLWAPNGRSIEITEPDGGKQLYLFTNGAPGVLTRYPQAPVLSPYASSVLDNTFMDVNNSFHWGKRQYAGLSSNFLTSGDASKLTANDYLRSRMRHWLRAEADVVSETLSMERAPSPDGVSEGQKTWYGYAGKADSEYVGTQILPLFTAQLLPDGTTRFTRTERNELGMPLAEVSTYSTASGVALRTNTFLYAANGIDLLAATNALGVRVLTNRYNDYHQVTTNWDALNQVTVFTYNSNQQVSSIARPSGLVTTNFYFQSGDTQNFLDRSIDYATVDGATVYYRTNVFTWANALVQTHTDPRGLTVGYTWDNLQRPTRLDFPDGTFITNTYDKLDLAQVVDRMGYTNSFEYNPVRQMTKSVNARGVVSLYDYCSCGSLEAVTNAFGTPEQQVTRYYYDLQGNLKQTLEPDNYTVLRNYNALGQVTNITDGTSSITNYYNNQGLLAGSFNAFGQVAAVRYDILDRAISTVDANGVTVTNAFDDLNRLLRKGYPDGGVEKFGYTFNVAGITSYTNQLDLNVANYSYDPLGRKRDEMNPGISTNRFDYSGAGDLLTLTDGKIQTTTWEYDVYGRTKRKLDVNGAEMFRYDYDANNRLTNRWTPEKGNTAYQLDPAGNCLSIHSPHSTISFLYDSLNRLTNMVDAIGTNRYSYNDAGQLATEDGPWDNDTVTYSYQNRLRTGLSLAQASGSPWVQSYLYDAAKRLTNITSAAGSFGYGYDPVRSLKVATLALPNSAYISSTFDSVSRLTGTYLKNSGGNVLDGYGYGYDLAGQRTNVSRSIAGANSSLALTYDAVGQLKTALGSEADATPRLQERFGYAYDPAGNLNWRTNNALVQQFGVNNLNELQSMSRTVNSKLTVAGLTTSRAVSVTVNTSNAVLYADCTFASTNHNLVDGANSFTAVAQNAAGVKDTISLTLNLPAATTLIYDLNGNLRTNGNQVLEYNDENQLTAVSVAGAWRSEFAYDGQHRRRVETNYWWNGTTWTATNETRFVYDGNLVIQHRDKNNAAVLTLTRGLDLSGSLQGAGGIGGLLAMTESSGTNSYHNADGSGNVTALVNANQLIVARYQYGPFGNTLSVGGPKAGLNPYRFSSKPVHGFSGMYDFLYRWYAPEQQRWVNRDPIAEQGGINLYGYVGNNPIGLQDPFGESPLGSPLAAQLWSAGASPKPTGWALQEAGKGVLAAATVVSVPAVAADFGIGSAIMYAGVFFQDLFHIFSNSGEKDPCFHQSGSANQPVIGAMKPSSPGQVAVHGNSLESMRPTWGYKLYSSDGTFLKNGITSRLVPESRYTKPFMSDKYMVPVKQFPNRLEAWQWEFQQNQVLRGPLNRNMH